MPTPVEEQPWGPDVSHHKGKIDFRTVKREGASFVYVKTGQGLQFTDPRGEQNYREAQSAGLLAGRYFYLDFDYPAEPQAVRFLEMCGGPRRPGELPRACDFENWSDDVEPRTPRTPAYMREHFRAFMEKYKEVAGEYPMPYTYVSFWRDTLRNPHMYGSVTPLWVADYSFKRPRKIGAWPWHTFHQFTSTGLIRGAVLVPRVGRRDFYGDLNRFNGSAERLPLLAGV